MALIDNIIAYYKFDENTGTNVADSTGNNNTGTFNGTGTIWTTGIINTGGQFASGNSDYVDIPSLNNNMSYSQITIQAWIKPSSVSNNDRYIADAHTDAGNVGFQLMLTGATNKIRFNVGNGSTNVFAEYATVLSINTWYHVVGVYNGANAIIYVNNISTTGGAMTGSLTSEASDLNIGRNPNYQGDYANSIIDEVAIWSRGLFPIEISQLYNNGSGILYPFNQNIRPGNEYRYGKVGAGMSRSESWT